jgi:hypothetical protein
MRTLEEAWDIVERLNDDAHGETFELWCEADELGDSEDEADWDKAEEVREQASTEQAEYFRDFWYELDTDDQELVKYWLDRDEDFREQFATYFGETEFIDEFENKDE